jgi:hypothetical protein
MSTPKPLSPAAQAIETAVLQVASAPGFERRRIIAAAALHAAAPFMGCVQDHGKLHTIATELEGSDG